jgi:hypothetical protein
MLLRMELDIALVVGSTTSAGGFSVSSAIFKDAFAEKGSLTKRTGKMEIFDHKVTCTIACIEGREISKKRNTFSFKSSESKSLARECLTSNLA